MPFQKGHPSFHTEKSKRKISKALKGRKPKNFYEMQKKGQEARRGIPMSGKRNIGWKLSKETKKKISKNSAKFWLNKILSRQTRKKISKVLKGKYINEKSPLWKGDLVGYSGLHIWVKKCLGQPDVCEFCKKKGLTGHQIHWANKSGKYKRDLKDWLRLCVKCHKIFDSNGTMYQ